MADTPFVLLPLHEYGCEGCFFLQIRQNNSKTILTGEVPCFACETMFLSTGERSYKASSEPEPEGTTHSFIHTRTAPPRVRL